jgi:hypothetical protein
MTDLTIVELEDNIKMEFGEKCFTVRNRIVWLRRRRNTQISWLAERLLAFQEYVWSLQLVTEYYRYMHMQVKDMATLWWSECTAGWGYPHWERTVRWAPWRRRGAVGSVGPYCGRGRASSHDQTAAVLPPPALLPTCEMKTHKYQKQSQFLTLYIILSSI